MKGPLLLRLSAVLSSGSPAGRAPILVELPFVTGHLSVPTAFAPVDWHIHEMLFGYQAAAVGGFLLTAIPNWTGRLPVQGKPLAVLVLALGSSAASRSRSLGLIGWRLAMAADVLFLVLLARRGGARDRGRTQLAQSSRSWR